MSLPHSLLSPGRQISLCAAGDTMSGQLVGSANGWLRLANGDGEILVQLSQVAWIRLGAGETGLAEPPREALPQPSSKDVVARPGSKVPGRPWSDETVRAVVDEFLNDRPDGEIAQVHNRTRNQITVLRQAWESARGNLPEDRLSPAAQLWVARIRAAMRPE
jgi:hypothetical protein